MAERRGIGKMNLMTWAIGVAVATTVLGLVGALGPAPARANAPINEFYVTPSSTQAGGHPNVKTLIWMSNSSTQSHPPGDCECHDVRNITGRRPGGVDSKLIRDS